MARGVNKVILIGNLGNDPEVRYMPNGNAVATISVATSESWKDRETGQQQERTEWHRVVLFNRLGEITGEYLRKGSKVYVEGALRTRKWQDKSGQDRYTTEIVGSALQMLDSRSGGSDFPDAGGMPGQQQQRQPMNNQFNQQAPQQHQQQPQQQAAPVTDMNEFDDDIPF